MPHGFPEFLRRGRERGQSFRIEWPSSGQRWLTFASIVAVLNPVVSPARDCGQLAQQIPLTDAMILASEASEELLPPADLIRNIERDLEAIRRRVPELENLCPTPELMPAKLHLSLSEDATQRLDEGTFEEFYALSTELGGVEIEQDLRIGGRAYLVVLFTKPYNSTLLAPRYDALPGVFALPGVGGISAQDIDRLSEFSYRFYLGWGECELIGQGGCEFSHYWDVAIVNGSILSIEETGSELPLIEGSWGSVKHMYRD